MALTRKAERQFSAQGMSPYAKISTRIEVVVRSPQIYNQKQALKLASMAQHKLGAEFKRKYRAEYTIMDPMDYGQTDKISTKLTASKIREITPSLKQVNTRVIRRRVYVKRISSSTKTINL